MAVAEVEILAFIDSDAYPQEDWLKNAAKHLQKEGVCGVGGSQRDAARGLVPPSTREPRTDLR